MPVDQVIVDNLLYVPANLLEHIYSIVNPDAEQLYCFDYRTIYPFLLEFGFPGSTRLRKRLMDHLDDGALYIAFVTPPNGGDLLPRLDQLFPQEDMPQAVAQLDGIYGMTIYEMKDKDGRGFNYLIMLNRNLFALDQWQSTLQHQLTHFLQRLAGIQASNSGHFDISLSQLARVAAELAGNGSVKEMNERLSELFQPSEIQEILQTLIHVFYDLYRKRKWFVGGEDSPRNPLDWLRIFLKKINSNEFMNGKEMQAIRSLSVLKVKDCPDDKKLFYHRGANYIILYMAVKRLLPEFDIDAALLQHFKHNSLVEKQEYIRTLDDGEIYQRNTRRRRY